jgi:lipoyl(octanoyl) transferase
MTGIWLGKRKIAAMGIAVKQWVTYHGFALNVNPDLHHFPASFPVALSTAPSHPWQGARIRARPPNM